MQNTGLTISEASYLTTLKLLVFRTAAEYVNETGVKPNMQRIEEITQRVKISKLRKLRRSGSDEHEFEAQLKRIVAEVLYEYSRAEGN